VLGEIVAISNCTSPDTINTTRPPSILLRADKVVVTFSRPFVHGSNASLEFTDGSALGGIVSCSQRPKASFYFVPNNSVPNGGNSSVAIGWEVELVREDPQDEELWVVGNTIYVGKLGGNGESGVKPKFTEAHFLGGIGWSSAKKGYRCPHVKIPFGFGNLKVENLTLVYNTDGNFTLLEEDYDHCLEDPADPADPAESPPKPLAWWAIILIVLGTLAAILILVCCVCCILCALGINFWEGVFSG